MDDIYIPYSLSVILRAGFIDLISGDGEFVLPVLILGLSLGTNKLQCIVDKASSVYSFSQKYILIVYTLKVTMVILTIFSFSIICENE